MIRDPFTAVPKSVLENPSISWAAKGFYAFCLAHSGESINITENERELIAELAANGIHLIGI